VTKPSQIVLGEALQLPLAERAEVVVERMASLDGEADHDAEAAWAEAVERRPHRVREGVSTGTDWERVRERAERRLFSSHRHRLREGSPE
jgi:hypothetical protein